MEMFQSNIYYYVRMKEYIVSTQELCLQKTYQEQVEKLVKKTQDSCACPTLLCMNNTLGHALEGPGPKAGTQTKSSRPGPNPRLLFLGPGLGPRPLQCMHTLCMHKNLAHAQESCACTRILCMHKNLLHAQYTLLFIHNNKYCSETFCPQRSDFLVHLHLHSRLRRIQ